MSRRTPLGDPSARNGALLMNFAREFRCSGPTLGPTLCEIIALDAEPGRCCFWKGTKISAWRSPHPYAANRPILARYAAASW